jgi:hypothetical protein
MSLPKPALDLKDHCSAVFNNTVYVYSPAGFQSLSLTEGAEWETLPDGVSVTGAVCVAGNNALYIVGGAANATSQSYSGLQRYALSDKAWETIMPIVPVTQNRQNHGATYINSSASILVYAGSQTPGDTIPSSQTFLIATEPPFQVLSFNSQAAPPLFAPTLLPWDEQRGLMIGGAADNKRVFTFGQPEGWVDLGTTLTDAVGDTTTIKFSIVTGDDSSKVLEKYNMGATPNEVTRIALWANGKPAPVGQIVGGPPSKRRRRTRDLTVDNWPAYNSSLAPTSKRAGYSLAESSNGLVVMTGGDPEDPLAIFDQRQNTWVNATSLLVGKNQVPLSSPTSSSLPSVSVVQPTSTSSPSPTSTGAGILGSGKPKSKVLSVLGGTLGAIFALAAILVLILLLLRWKRNKNKVEEREVQEKDARLSFADQGAEFMHEAGGSRGRAYSQSINGSAGSLPMFNSKGSKGGAKGAKSNHKRGMPSDSSQMGLVKAKSPLGINEPLEMSQMSEKSSPTYAASSRLGTSAGNSPPSGNPAPIAAAVAGAHPDEDSERSRSNGWSRYFANNEVTNLASMQAGRNTFSTEGDTYRSSDVSRSEYEERNMSNSSVRPLELNLGPKFDGQRLSRVATGSPTMGRSNNDVQEGLTAQISRAGSTSSNGSEPHTYGYASTVDAGSRDGTNTWTPVSNWTDHGRSAGDTKSIGSVYSDAGANPYLASGINPYHTDNPPPALPEMKFGGYGGEHQRDSQASAVTVFPSGIGGSPKLAAFPKSQLAKPKPQPLQQDSFDFPMPKAYFGSGQNRDSAASNYTVASNVTVFPRGVPSPTTSTFPKPKLIDTKSPPVPPVPPVPVIPDSPTLRRGPVIRKTTGDEDMSWLNINAGRAI